MDTSCNIGEIPLNETRKCQKNGYTCHLLDGPKCCKNRLVESRPCIPCDETKLRKPSGSSYSQAGTCEYLPGLFIN